MIHPDDIRDATVYHSREGQACMAQIMEPKHNPEPVAMNIHYAMCFLPVCSGMVKVVPLTNELVILVVRR